jgi:hypothetical protein
MEEQRTIKNRKGENMKKLLVCLILALGCVSIASAADEVGSINVPIVVETLKNIDLDNGVCYSVLDSAFNYSATVEAITSKDKKFKLNVGYAGRAPETKDKIIASGSVDLLKLKDYIDVPILDLIVIEPYIYIGYHVNLDDLKDSEFDWGPGVKLVKMTFN